MGMGSRNKNNLAENRHSNNNGVFTMPDTDTDTNTDTDTDKMGLQPNCICVSVCVFISVGQYEHFHTILYNPFFIGVGVGQCEHTIRQLFSETLH